MNGAKLESRNISHFYLLGRKAKLQLQTGFYPLQAITWHKKAQMNLFSTQDEAYHREQKRPIANAYSLGSLLAKEGAVDSCSTLFIEQLGIYADRGEAVDLGTWLQYYAFDVTGELTFATKLGFLEQGKDIDGMMAAISGLLVSGRLIWKYTLTELYRTMLPSLGKYQNGTHFSSATLCSPTSCPAWRTGTKS